MNSFGFKPSVWLLEDACAVESVKGGLSCQRVGVGEQASFPSL